MANVLIEGYVTPDLNNVIETKIVKTIDPTYTKTRKLNISGLGDQLVGFDPSKPQLFTFENSGTREPNDPAVYLATYKLFKTTDLENRAVAEVMEEYMNTQAGVYLSENSSGNLDGAFSIKFERSNIGDTQIMQIVAVG